MNTHRSDVADLIVTSLIIVSFMILLIIAGYGDGGGSYDNPPLPAKTAISDSGTFPAISMEKEVIAEI